jgi:uncharacterized surface protein with fasciclin (FAS1) repeats
MKLSTLLAVALLGACTNAQNNTLLYALRYLANATQFADFLEANPDILATYNSTSVQTIFAPSDAHFTSPLRRRQASPSSLQNSAIQYSHDLNSFHRLNPANSPGAVVTTGLSAPLAGGSQSIVSQEVVANGTTRRRRAVPSSGVELLSGLGSSVNIINSDIPYNNGLIHVTDGLFTIPTTLSSTINSTGLSTLGSLLSSANLSNTFDTSNSITIFTPSNTAFSAASNSTNNPATLPNLLSNHVIPNFLGYLPSLTDGASYKTLAGETLTISIKNGVYFVNGARIIASNTILANGVAHTIDRVLVPTPSPVFSAGTSLMHGHSAAVAVAAAVFTMLMM